MADAQEAEIEALLQRLRGGDEEAAGELFTRLYGELRALASALFRGQGAGHTLQPTAVLHEAFVKMVRSSGAPGFQDRAHFFAVAAKAMRQVLVNHARDRSAKKRGGGEIVERFTLDGVAAPAAVTQADVLDVNQALEELEALDARQARVAELRFFGGLTNKEIADVIGVSLRTVELDWKMAKAWLAGRLAGTSDRPEPDAD